MNLWDTGKIASSFGVVSFGLVSFSLVSFSVVSFSEVSFSAVLFSLEVSFKAVLFSLVLLSAVSFSIVCCAGVYAEASPATKIKKNIIPLITSHPQFAEEKAEKEIGGNPLAAFALSLYRQLPK